jgi:hypothetical protein
MKTETVEPLFDDELLLRILDASPHKLAMIQRVLTEQPQPDPEPNGANSQPKPLARGGSVQAGTPARDPCLFRKVGRQWEVDFGECERFYLADTLGAKYLDYLLHHPNRPISAFDLEMVITPEKGEARLRNGSRDERAFAEHLERHVSVGMECLYSQAHGRVWS